MPERKNNSNNVFRYSGIGLQIVATFGLGFFLGYKLDGFLGNSKPYFTALLSLLFLGVAFYLALKDLLKN